MTCARRDRIFRDHGVLAPNAKMRPLVVPKRPPVAPTVDVDVPLPPPRKTDHLAVVLAVVLAVHACHVTGSASTSLGRLRLPSVDA